MSPLAAYQSAGFPAVQPLDWAETALGQDVLGLAEERWDMQALRGASTTMAEIEILENRPDAARTRLVPLRDRPGLRECDVTMFLPLLAWAYLELGQVDLAAEAVEKALARARPEEMRQCWWRRRGCKP